MAGKWHDLESGGRVYLDTFDPNHPGTTGDIIARLAWDRFAPEHEMSFDECVHKDEYARFGRDVMALALGEGFRFPSGIRAIGVGHVGDNPRALIVTLTQPPGDADIRALHDWLVHRPSAMDAEWCVNMARQEGDSEIGAGLLARDPAPTLVEPSDAERSAWPQATEQYVAGLEATLAAIEEDGTEEHNAAVELRHEVAALRLALEPFAKIEVPPDAGDGTWVAKTVYCNDQVTASSVRRARDALTAARGKKES